MLFLHQLHASYSRCDESKRDARRPPVSRDNCAETVLLCACPKQEGEAGLNGEDVSEEEQRNPVLSGDRERDDLNEHPVRHDDLLEHPF